MLGIALPDQNVSNLLWRSVTIVVDCIFAKKLPYVNTAQVTKTVK
jgi:hypothetical protein